MKKSPDFISITSELNSAFLLKNRLLIWVSKIFTVLSKVRNIAIDLNIQQKQLFLAFNNYYLYLAILFAYA